MAEEIVLTVEPRAARGRSEVRKLRADGLLPGVIYGAGIDPVALSVPRHELLRVLHQHGAHPLVTVKVSGGREYLALIKDLTVDPVRQQALHVDFHRVQEDKPVQTEVEIVVTGTPVGVRQGGILDVIVRAVSIEALPRDLPEKIEFDASEMEMGSTARVGELTAPRGVTILTDPDQTLCTVVAPATEVETLSPEDAEALGALSEEDLAALKEYVAAVEEAAAEAAPEGEEAAPEAAEGQAESNE